MKMNSSRFGVFILYTSLLYAGVTAYDEFHKACVVAHNKLRKLHGAQSVAWSEELGDGAQKWCEELALKDVLAHDNKTMDTENQGENLAAMAVADPKSEGATPEQCTLAVQKWYMEEGNYNYQTGLPKGPGMPIKHFAQVVWNDTFEIGAGTARSTVHGDIICVRYSPRGAEGGPSDFKKNILPNTGSVLSNFSQGDFNVKNGQGFKCKYGDPQGCSQEGGNYGGSLSCGVGKKSRIVGGKQARPSEFPWQVGFRWQTRNSRTNIFCGGSLIDKKWVVSAAHCFQNLRRPINELKIVLGEFDVNNEEGNEVVIAARKVTNHPRYNSNSMDNDIAIVELDSEVSFNDNMKPVCLPSRGMKFRSNTMCTVTGFGAIREGGPQATTLMKADVPLVDNQKCSEYYRSPISDLKICAGYDKGKIDSCQGDSGGPLVCPQNGKAYLAGVVSYGIGCARPKLPGVYANVKNLLDFIEDVKGSA